MDFSVSPDLDAVCCYGVVALLGVWVSARQISRRLGGIAGLWMLPGTWLLFLLYLAIPVGLFWLLDQTGAITDTSLFAAILVGGGYERIISGQNNTIHATGDLSRFWTPFLAFADNVQKTLLQQTARARNRLDDRIVDWIAATDQRTGQFRGLMRSRVEDVAALDTRLAGIDALAADLGVGSVRERKARALYGTAVSLPDGYRLIYERGIIPWRLYVLFKCGGDMKLRYAAVLVLLLAGCGFAAMSIHLDSGWLEETYRIWRIGKSTTTAADQFRSRRHLVLLMQDPRQAPRAVTDVATLLRRPGLPTDRADLILQAMLEAKAAGGAVPDLPPSLVQSLRAGNVDVRARVNDVLKFLAATCGAVPDEGLWGWKPVDDVSTAVLEERITGWSTYWSRQSCKAPT